MNNSLGSRNPWILAIAFSSLLLLMLTSGTAFADAAQEIVARAKPAVVQIVASDANWTPIKTGTGFFVSADGDLLTNFHVIQGATHIIARTDKGAMFVFERLVAGSPESDVALLKFQVTDVDYLKLGTSSSAVEGETVLVIGNPEGLQGTISNGIISAFRENRSLIQITAPISPGSSGSPVLDETGQVIGMATLIYKEGQNLNFAISSGVIESVIHSGLVSATPVPSATPSQVSDQQATAAFNFLQDRLGKPRVKRVWYDPGTDSYSWIGPKFGRKMSIPRSQFDAEIWPDYVKAYPVPGATPSQVSDEQATAAFNFLQDRLGKPRVKRVWYDPGTDSYSWIGPKFGKKMSIPRIQFDAEIWPDYVKAYPTKQSQ